MTSTTKRRKFVRFFRLAKFLLFLILGCYITYLGDVWDRYRLKRSNFAEFDEDVIELPTVISSVNQLGSVLGNETIYPKLGEDFNVSYQALTISGVFDLPPSIGNFTHNGRYDVAYSHLKIDFEQLLNASLFKITPVNFSPGMVLDYVLTYTFDDSSIQKYRISGIQSNLVPENNSEAGSWLIGSTKLYDGKYQSYSSKLGFQTIVTYAPEKKKFLEDKEPCRKVPYNDLLFTKISNEINRCPTPCRKRIFFGQRLDKIIGHLPFCKTDQELECFKAVAWNAHQSITIKPCTQLQYDAETQSSRSIPMNQARFIFRFLSPPRVTVREEYLIYDFVTMIGAIGGTMGLCIGFSFNDVCDCLINYLEKRWKQI